MMGSVENPSPPAFLVFTRTTDYRHESIDAGVQAVTALAAADGLVCEHTEDPAAFEADALLR